MAEQAFTILIDGKLETILFDPDQNSTGDNNIDGGFANSTYLPDQCFDGGGA